MYDIMVVIIIVLITLLKKMLNKIQEFEKRLDDTKIVQLDEKKEHTEKTEKMLNKIQELEKRLDDNNIIDFCEALDLQNKIQELEKRLDYDAIKVLYEHSDKIEELEKRITDLDENKEVVNQIVIALCVEGYGGGSGCLSSVMRAHGPVETGNGLVCAGHIWFLAKLALLGSETTVFGPTATALLESTIAEAGGRGEKTRPGNSRTSQII